VRSSLAFIAVFLFLLALAYKLPWEETVCAIEPAGPGRACVVEGYVPKGVDLVKTEHGLCFLKRKEPNDG